MSSPERGESSENQAVGTTQMKVILFDMMQTLIHEPYFAAIGRLLPADLDAKTYFHWRDKESFIRFERGEIAEHEHLQQFYLPDTPADLLERFPRPEKVRKALFQQLRYIEGIPELLAELQRRDDVRTGIASNYAEWYTEILKRLPRIHEGMDYLFFSCEMGVRKPDASYYELIETALRKGLPQLKASEIFFTDDRQINLDAAQERGWATFRMQDDAAALQSAIRRFLKEPAS